MIRRTAALALSLLLLLTACAAPEAEKPEEPPSRITAVPADPVPKDDSPATGEGGDSGNEAEAPALPEDNGSQEEKAEEGRRIDPSRPMVALTYDDGPHKEYTSQLLDILEENQAVATFFEVARYLPNAAEAVRRAEAMGCEVGSHSYRHADLGKLTAEQIQADQARAEAIFEEVLGHRPALLRPPYGSVNRALRSATGRSLIMWSIDTEDWRSRDVDKILASVQDAGDLDGQVILMHSTYDTSVEASRRLIPWLIQQGYQLVTVSELITLHYQDELAANGLYNFEYFHFGRPVSLPAAAPAVVPEQPVSPPQTEPPAGEPAEPQEPLPPAGEQPEEGTGETAAPEDPAETGEAGEPGETGDPAPEDGGTPEPGPQEDQEPSGPPEGEDVTA